jgi:hypothetical protein
MVIAVTLSEFILLLILAIVIILYLAETFIGYVVYQIRKRLKK